MGISNIIGKGKAFEPPFHTDIHGFYIYDNTGETILEVIPPCKENLAKAICELLNERWKNEIS